MTSEKTPEELEAMVIAVFATGIAALTGFPTKKAAEKELDALDTLLNDFDATRKDD